MPVPVGLNVWSRLVAELCPYLDAATGPVALGRIEVGVTTHEAYRGRGYATITCARLIQACEEQGYATWWDCARQNVASVAPAYKLGYQDEREYRVLAWSQRP